MKIIITEYDSNGGIMQTLEYVSYQETEIQYGDMIARKENENGKKESRKKEQKTIKGTV